MIYLIAAMGALTNGIGIQNALPWKLKDDLNFFKRTTQGSAVVMGRKTFDSLPFVLPGRLNVVITRDLSDKEPKKNLVYATSLEEGLEKAKMYSDDVYVIGGEQIYRAALPMADVIYLTEVRNHRHDVKYDAFFPVDSMEDWVVEDVVGIFDKSEDNDHPFRIYKLVKDNDPKPFDYQYYQFKKRLAGRYAKECDVSKETRVSRLALRGSRNSGHYKKHTFCFPSNARTFSPYYLCKFLPKKVRLDSKKPLTDYFDVRVSTGNPGLDELVKKRAYNAIRIGLLLNECIIV